MKKVIFLFALCLVFFIRNLANAQAVYAPEMNLIEVHHVAMIGSANEIIEKSEKFLKVWDQISFQMKLTRQALQAFTGKEIKAGSEKSELLNSLIRESVFVEQALARVKLASDRVNVHLHESEEVVREAWWLAGFHYKNRDSVIANLRRVVFALQARKLAVEANLAQWNERQMKEWLKLEASKSLQFSEGIRADNVLAQVEPIFFQIHNRVRLGILGHKKDEAEDALRAAVWFRSVVPVFFLDKVLTEYGQMRLKSILSNAEQTEDSLKKTLSSMRLGATHFIALDRMIASLGEGSSSPSEVTEWKKIAEARLGVEGGGHAPTSDQVEHGGLVIEFLDKDIDGYDAKEKNDKVANEYSLKSDSPGTGQGSVGKGIGGKQGDEGIARVSGKAIAENVKVDNRAETKAKIDAFVKDVMSGKVTSSGADRTGSDIKGLLDRARPGVPSKYKQSFDQLVAANDALKYSTDLFEKVVRGEAGRINRVTENAKAESKALNSELIAAPTINIEQVFGPDPSGEIAFARGALNDALQAPSSASLDELNTFVSQAVDSIPAPTGIEPYVLQDVLEEARGIPVGQRTLAGGGPYHPRGSYGQRVAQIKIGRIEDEVRRAQSIGRISHQGVVSISSRISQIIQENNISPDQIAASTSGFGSAFPLPARIKSVLEVVARIGLGFTPIGALIDFVDVVTGVDFFTGERLTDFQRILCVLGLIVGQGGALKSAVSESIASASPAIGRTISKIEGALAKGSKPVLGNKYVTELKDLVGTEKAAFENELYKKGIIEPGDILPQGQNFGQKYPGNWFGTIAPVDPEHAEELWNIGPWGKRAEKIIIYRAKERCSGYVGKVANGEGYQYFIPKNVDLNEVLEEISF